MKLLLTRHGQTDWNRENRVMGRTDAPLNDMGLRQAEELVERLRGTDLQAVYASPLVRAGTIGRMAAEDHGLVCQTDPRLIELDFGRCEGLQRDDPRYLTEKRRLFARYPGGESYFQAAARVYPFLEDLGKRHPDDTVLVVTHNGICRIIASYFLDLSEEEFLSFSMENCQVRTFIVPAP